MVIFTRTQRLSAYGPTNAHNRNVGPKATACRSTRLAAKRLIQPLVLTIDDLQWANSPTLNLFGFLAMRLGDLPALIVGTVQNASAVPALARLVALGRRRGVLHSLLLSSLTEQDIARLLETLRFSLSSSSLLTGGLHERSAGSPFVLSEILAQMRSEGIVEPVGARWQLDTLRWRATCLLPETTHALVAWRLSNISSQQRSVLQVLAVAGHALHLAVLREMPGVGFDQLVELLDDLIDRQLIAEIDTDRFNLPNYILRETLLHDVSQIRRRVIHRKLALVLERHLGALADEQFAWGPFVVSWAISTRAPPCAEMEA